MDNELGSYEYEHKLYSLKILNEAQKLGLINREQYVMKQNEFLRSIHFSVDEDDDDANSNHAAELLRRTPHAYHPEEDYHPQVRQTRKRTPSSRMRHMDDDIDDEPYSRVRRRRVSTPRYRQPSNLEENNVNDGERVGEDEERKMIKGVMSSPEGDENPREGKHKTFSEFIFAALRHLGGEAELQELYQYVYENKEDIDPRFSYRFKTGDYKSNVRSTLHNTGSFHKNSNGKWTIDSPLKGRGRM